MVPPSGLVRAAPPQLFFRPAGGHYWTSIGVAVGCRSTVLRTSHTDWDAEKILRTYWRLTDLENTFRQLKSELGLRPIWHSTDARISAHLFITVLAYHAVHLIRTRLRDNDINLRWDSIRNRMASWERITTTQQTPTGQQVVVRQDARLSDEAATIARHVNVHVGAYRQRL